MPTGLVKRHLKAGDQLVFHKNRAKMFCQTTRQKKYSKQNLNSPFKNQIQTILKILVKRKIRNFSCQIVANQIQCIFDHFESIKLTKIKISATQNLLKLESDNFEKDFLDFETFKLYSKSVFSQLHSVEITDICSHTVQINVLQLQ